MGYRLHPSDPVVSPWVQVDRSSFISLEDITCIFHGVFYKKKAF
jgi:hypothetical protein